MSNKILGVSPPSKKINYMDFELTKFDVEDLKKAYEVWAKDDSYIKDYDGYDFLPYAVDLVLVRVFRYEETSPLLAPGGDDHLVLTKVLPYCKVIKSSSGITPGTILLGSDRLSEIITNPDWLKWRDIIEKERPTLDIPEPSKIIGVLAEWRNASKFVLDKFKPTIDDEYTFIRPLSEFKMALKK